MCFDPISAIVGIGGAALSGVGTKMQNDANNKTARLQFMENERAREQTYKDLREINDKNKAIDYENNDRQNADIKGAEDLQFQQLQQDAEEVRVRNQVLDEFLARQRKASLDNAQTIHGGTVTQGSVVNDIMRGGAAAGRTASAGAAIDAGGATDAGFRDSTPDVVRQALSAALAGSRDSAKSNAAAASGVAAYGDAFGRQEMGMADILGQIKMRNDFAKGDLSLLPAEQELRGAMVRQPLYARPATLLSERWAAPNPTQPNQIQPKENQTASLLKGVGSLVSSFAGSGKAPAAVSSVASWFK